MEANRLRRLTTPVTSAGLARTQFQVCALWRESWLYIFSILSKHEFHTARCLVYGRQRGNSHLLGVKTTGVTQCKQNGHVPHAPGLCERPCMHVCMCMCMRVCAHFLQRPRLQVSMKALGESLRGPSPLPRPPLSTHCSSGSTSALASLTDAYTKSPT